MTRIALNNEHLQNIRASIQRGKDNQYIRESLLKLSDHDLREFFEKSYNQGSLVIPDALYDALKEGPTRTLRVSRRIFGLSFGLGALALTCASPTSCVINSKMGADPKKDEEMLPLLNVLVAVGVASAVATVVGLFACGTVLSNPVMLDRATEQLCKHLNEGREEFLGEQAHKAVPKVEGRTWIR